MNILFLCDEYPPGRHGGIGTAVQTLARALVRAGNNVVVAGFCDWGYGGADEEDDKGVKVYRFRRGLNAPGLFGRRDRWLVRAAYKVFTKTGIFELDIRRSLARYRIFIERIIERHSIQIVEMPDYQEYLNYIRTPVFFPGWPVPAVVKLHGNITYLRTITGEAVERHFHEPERAMLKKADAIAAVSRFIAGVTATNFGLTAPIEVLYNGIELPAESEAIKKQENEVIFTGSLLKIKGIYQLVKAWNKVIEVAPEAALHIYGKGAQEKVVALLSDKAAPSVHFHGHVDRSILLQEIARAAVAVYPSYSEAFALAPLEALAGGTATIYTSRASGPELVRDGIDGLLADPDDVDALAAAILRLLGDAELRGRLARQGKQRVIDTFEIKHIAGGHIRFYEKVIQDYKPGKQ